MAYKKPNVKGSRVRAKSTVIMSEKRLKEFKKKFPEYESLTLGEFNSIVKQFNLNIIDAVEKERYGIALPERIGQFIIVGFPKSKRKMIDFGASNKAGTKIYHRNMDTDGRIGKLLFQNGASRFNIKYHKLWTFKATRSVKKKVSNAFLKSWPRYIFIDKNMSLRTITK
jgi:hypothetical protein